MKFKEMTPEDVDYLSTIYLQTEVSHEEKMDNLSKKFEVTPRTIRKWAKKLNLSNKHHLSTMSKQLLRAEERSLPDCDIVLVTAAQNKTSVNKGFIDSLKSYKSHLKKLGYKAEIVIIPSQYRNPTSIKESRKKLGKDWWVDEIDEYLYYGKIHFGDTLIAADSRVVPTAKIPLNGYESLASQNNLVLGHPRIHFKTLPRFKDQKLRTMNTTGFCTVKNYSKSKSGDIAYIHHSYGFTIVEKKPNGNCYIPRTVKVNSDGTFTDLQHRCTPKGVTKVSECKGFIAGDIHLRHIDQQKMLKTQKILTKIRPKEIVLHDVFDGATVNPHETKDLFIQKRKILEGENIVNNEVKDLLDFLTAFSLIHYDSEVKVVQSNHDDFLDRWVNNFDWKKDLHNSETYLELAKIQQTIDLRKYGNLIGYLLHTSGHTYIPNSESHFIGDYQVGHHGEYGINGARGSINSFKKLSQKMIHGHSHCLPGKYKVQFKDKGWGEINSVKKGDTILSFNPQTKRNEWTEVQDFIEVDYKDVMYKVKGNGFEQTFTKDHMLMMCNGDYIKASDAILSRSSSELPLTALPAQNDGIIVPEEVVKRIVAIAADGSKDNYRIRFHLKKERKIKRLKELFGDALIQYNSKDGSYDGYISTRGPLYKELMKYKNFSGSKKLTQDILKWDTSSLSVLEEELRHWDGTYDTGSSARQYSTTSKGEANYVMSALNRLGYSCTQTLKKGVNENHNDVTVISWCKNKSAVKNSEKGNHKVRFGGWNFDSYQADCKVYCVTVKNKCFWVQSGNTGQVSLTGNSPAMVDGVTCVGVSCKLWQYYNSKGLSSWAHSDCIIHADGKSQLIVYDETYEVSNLI